MLRSLGLAAVLVFATGCALIPPSHPDLAYYPAPGDPAAIKISRTLHRAAQAVGDDPEDYSFAMIETPMVTSFAADHATFLLLRRPRAAAAAPRGRARRPEGGARGPRAHPKA